MIANGGSRQSAFSDSSLDIMYLYLGTCKVYREVQVLWAAENECNQKVTVTRVFVNLPTDVALRYLQILLSCLLALLSMYFIE